MPSDYYTSYIPFITATPKEECFPVGNTNRQRVGGRELLPTSSIVLYIAEAIKNKVALCLTGLLCVSISSFFLMALKNIRILCLGFLCFMLFNLSDAWAQSAETRAAEGQTEIKPLQIGDTIPEELWSLPLQVVNHPDGKNTVTLNDYRDKKLIILDFWATWCGSCINKIPKSDDLQNKFSDDIQIIYVTQQDSSQLVTKKEYIEPNENLLFAFDDTVWSTIFPHRLVPHLVWLNTDRKVLSISNSASLSEANLITYIDSGILTIKQKQDRFEFDRKKTLIENLSALGVEPLYSRTCVIAPYISGIGAYNGITSAHGRKHIIAINTDMINLYRTALNLGILDNNIEVDSLSQLFHDSNGGKIKYSFELIANDNLGAEHMKMSMLKELNAYFNSKIKVTYVKGKPHYIIANSDRKESEE